MIDDDDDDDDEDDREILRSGLPQQRSVEMTSAEDVSSFTGVRWAGEEAIENEIFQSISLLGSFYVS